MKLLMYIMLCLIWGSTWLVIKLGLEDAPPLWSAALRFILAAALLYGINYFTGHRYPVGWRNKWRAAWPGIFTFFGSYALTYMGENHISSALAAILFAVFPFFIMALMPMMVKTERIGIKSLIGAIVGFAGVVVIFAEPVQIGSGALIGMIFLILSPICGAIGSVSVKAYLQNEPVFPMITLQMTVGAILLTLAAFVFEPFSNFKFTTTSVGAIVFLAIFGSIITFGGYYWLFKQVRLVTMSMVALITPVVAMFVGYIVLKEELTVINYIGAALVLLGVAIVNIKQTHEIDVKPTAIPSGKDS
jgi:drug/metabolite transporter (DMT)-like permease